MDTTFIRQAKQATDRRLYIAFELAQRHWRLAFSDAVGRPRLVTLEAGNQVAVKEAIAKARAHFGLDRSEEHTSELQSLTNLVCRLLLEKKKETNRPAPATQRNRNCQRRATDVTTH